LSIILRVLHRTLLTSLALWAGFWLLVFLTSSTGYTGSGQDMAIWMGLGVPGGILILLYGGAWTLRGIRR